MNDYPTQDTIEVNVTDFGPIGEAKIDLRPLTVFVGPSNTGKSYLAILIYSLHRFFGGSHWPGYWMFNEEGLQKPPTNANDSLKTWASQVIEDLDKVQAEKSIVLPPSVMDVVRSGFNKLSGFLEGEIYRCFGNYEAGKLVRKGNSEEARFAFRKRCSNISAPIEHVLSITSKGIKFTETPAESVPTRINIQDTNKLIDLAIEILEAKKTDEVRDFDTWQRIETLTGFAMTHILNPLYSRAFYLPADRTGVMHAHSAVVTSIIGNAPMAGLQPTRSTPMLSGVLTDFLQQLIALAQPPYQWPQYLQSKPQHDLSTQMEKAILKGSIRVKGLEMINYPSFTYLPEGWEEEDELPLMNASSMVSELAPVVLYLRHMVDSGNILIVEEPESHLHPAMQVKLIRQIASLVNSGIRVIVTTHSEWVLEELANIVRRSEVSETYRKNMADGNYSLRTDQVGAWLFEPRDRPQGSEVKEIGLGDSGTYPAGYDEVAASLHNDWADISSRIGETG